MLLNSRQFKFLKNYRNVNVKSSAKREYRDENVFHKGDRALSKLIILLISNKKEFNHFFKSKSSDIVLLKVGNLHQNAKRYEARSTERVARNSYTLVPPLCGPLKSSALALSYFRPSPQSRQIHGS